MRSVPLDDKVQFLPNNFVQASPVCAILFVLSQVPGLPDDNRSTRAKVDYFPSEPNET